MNDKMQEMNFIDFYAPDFRIKIGGKDQKELYSEIISLEVDERLEGSSMFTLNINEGWNANKKTFKWLDNPLINPDNGLDVAIQVGYANRGIKVKDTLIKGKITSLSPNFPSSGIPTLSVQGYDHSFCLQKTVVKKKKTFEKEKNYGAIVKKILSDHPNIKAGQIDPTVNACEKIVQNANESDYQFIKRLADRIGFEFFITNGELFFREPNDSEFLTKSDEIITLSWGKELISFNPRLSTAKVVTKVTVQAHDPKNKKAIKGVATLKDIGIKDSKLENTLKSANDCQKKELETSKHDIPVCDEKDAKILAKSLLRKANNSLIEGNCECIGMPEIRPGKSLNIKGVGDRFNGKYYVKSAKHSIGDGYKTSFEVRRGI